MRKGIRTAVRPEPPVAASVAASAVAAAKTSAASAAAVLSTPPAGPSCPRGSHPPRSAPRCFLPVPHPVPYPVQRPVPGLPVRRPLSWQLLPQRLLPRPRPCLPSRPEHRRVPALPAAVPSYLPVKQPPEVPPSSAPLSLPQAALRLPALPVWRVTSPAPLRAVPVWQRAPVLPQVPAPPAAAGSCCLTFPRPSCRVPLPWTAVSAGHAPSFLQSRLPSAPACRR